jgi:hypothetical protein
LVSQNFIISVDFSNIIITKQLLGKIGNLSGQTLHLTKLNFYLNGVILCKIPLSLNVIGVLKKKNGLWAHSGFETLKEKCGITRSEKCLHKRETVTWGIEDCCAELGC